MNIFVILGILLLLVLAYFIWKEFRKKRRVRREIDEKLFLPKKIKKRKKAERAPVTGVCYSCGKKVTMPYKCKFCGNLFCDKHRLPENHKCAGLKRLKRDKNK